MFGNNNRGGPGGQKYSQVSHYSDSEDDSSASDGDADLEDDFVQREIRQQKMMMKRQDEGLEMLGQSAERLGQLSLGIHEELDHQTKMLDEMEGDLETAGENLNLVTVKTKELIRKSGGKRNLVIIVVLTIITIVLFFLVLYGV